MIDTTDVATEIRHLISTGAEGNKLLIIGVYHIGKRDGAEGR
jgi:hypothetical protein